MLTLAAAAAANDEAERYKGWQVRSFKLEGVADHLRKDLRRGLVLSGESTLFGTDLPRFYVDILQADIARVRLFLARRGYPRATVTPRFEPRTEARSLAITFQVDAGPPVRVDRIGIEGEPPELEGPLADQLALRERDVFTDDGLSRSVRRMESALRERGYAEAKVSSRVTTGPDGNANVVFRVDAGQVYRFGDVEVNGVPDDLVNLVRVSSQIREGEVYAPSALNDADANLRRLDLFRKSQLRTRPDGDGVLDVRAEMVTLPWRSLEFGVGYLTDDLFWGRGRWKHRNLFGRGRGLEFQAAASQFRLNAGVSAWYPALFHGRTRGTLRLYAERELEKTYTETTYEIGVGLRTRLTQRSSWHARLAFSDVTVKSETDDATAFLEEGGVLTVLTLGFERDSSDDPLYPRRGSVTNVQLLTTPVPPLTGVEFVSLELNASKYQGFGPLVLATRLGSGVAVPVDESEDLLPSYRFFAGGASSMRGFRRRRLGPVDTAGDPIGGQAKVEGAVELRFPLIGFLRGAVFLDAGQVWEDRNNVDFSRMEFAAGPALLITTPVGPIRGDVGFRLTDHDTRQPDTVFHLTIGQPF